jgi:hypothetical protein
MDRSCKTNARAKNTLTWAFTQNQRDNSDRRDDRIRTCDPLTPGILQGSPHGTKSSVYLATQYVGVRGRPHSFTAIVTQLVTQRPRLLRPQWTFAGERQDWFGRAAVTSAASRVADW